MDKEKLYSIISILFCCIIIISNVLATKVVDMGFVTIPASIIIFPVIYILNDVLSDVYGFERARKIIIAGFFAAALAAGFFQLAIELPGIDPVKDSAFSLTLGSGFRILTASLIAYLAGSLLNSKVMVSLKAKFADKLFMRVTLSTALGETVDSLIFISIVFIGTYSLPIILTMIASQALLKTIYEVVLYPLTAKIIVYVHNLPDTAADKTEDETPCLVGIPETVSE